MKSSEIDKYIYYMLSSLLLIPVFLLLSRLLLFVLFEQVNAFVQFIRPNVLAKGQRESDVVRVIEQSPQKGGFGCIALLFDRWMDGRGGVATRGV